MNSFDCLCVAGVGYTGAQTEIDIVFWELL